MKLIAILSLILAASALLLYVHHRLTGGDRTDSKDDGVEGDAADNAADDSECCGMHITCERDSLLTAVSPEIVYYDDEELDVYAGRGADDYTDEETEQFRDVLYTLLPDDIAGWGRSIQLRGITLPSVIKDELLLIVSEARAARNHA